MLPDLGNVVAGLEAVLTWQSLLILTLGTIGGIIIGVIPGLGTAMAVAVLIPVTFTLPPQVGIGLLVAVFVGGITGGCMSAILMRMPGTPASIATTLDGFPLTQQGRAGEAIGNAVVASFFGTIISGVVLILLTPLLAGFALTFHFAEYFAICIFALTAVAAITGSTLTRGLLMATLGLLLATAGLSNEDGLPRFTFGFEQMLGGINFVPAIMGLFAISQLMKDAVRPEEQVTVAKIERLLPTGREIRSNIGNYLRSGLIGTVVGVVPAVGGATASLIAYAQAKNGSKTPEKFGTGHLPGVIASETANNALIGGTLIITLTLGIPGDPTSALLIGGLMIHGLQPGPQLFMNSPEVVYAIYFTVFFSSIVMMLTMIGAMRPLARITTIPRRILLPLIFILAATGIYALNNRVFDVVVMCAFGGLGYILDTWRYPLAPLVLGLVLGPLVEGNFRKMVGQYGDVMPLFTEPVALVFMIATGLSIAYSFWQRRRERART